MPINKNAQLRYEVLDKCFSDFDEEYFIDDLTEACQKELNKSVSKDQIRKDIKFLKDKKNAPIQSIRSGQSVFYRYENPDYSIMKNELTQTEREQITSVIKLLSRFKGLPHYNWIEDILLKLQSSLKFKATEKQVVFFQNKNEFLKGFEKYFSSIFDAIVYKKVLFIEYKAFGSDTTRRWTITPYILKEYNNRWFLVGYCKEDNKIFNIPIDRIVLLQKSLDRYSATDIDFEEYFDDVIGVTLFDNEKLVDIELCFSANRFPYVITKPLHPSQKTIKSKSNTIQISVKPNNELIALLLSFGKDVEVIKPIELRNKIKKEVEEIISHYDKDCK